MESEPPYQYVRGNVVNRVDPSGLCTGDTPDKDPHCWTAYYQIVSLCPECALLERITIDGSVVKLHEEDASYLYNVLAGIHAGWSPLRVPPWINGANGYVEGRVATASIMACVTSVQGEEIVYDFASGQRQKFTYTEAHDDQKAHPILPSGLAFSIYGGSEVKYAGYLWEFSGVKGVRSDYSGYFVGTSTGLDPTVINTSKFFGKPFWGASMPLGIGQFTGAGSADNPWAAINGRGVVRGKVLYYGGGVGLDKSIASSLDKALGTVSKKLPGLAAILNLPIDASFAATDYTPAEGSEVDFYRGRELQMLRDLRNGDSSPVSIPQAVRDRGVTVGANVFVKQGRMTPGDYVLFNRPLE